MKQEAIQCVKTVRCLVELGIGSNDLLQFPENVFVEQQVLDVSKNRFQRLDETFSSFLFSHVEFLKQGVELVLYRGSAAQVRSACLSVLRQARFRLLIA